MVNWRQARDPEQTAKALAKERQRLEAMLAEQVALEAEVTTIDVLTAGAQANGNTTVSLERQRIQLGRRAAQLARQIERQRQCVADASREDGLARYEALLKGLHDAHQKYRSILAEIDDLVGEHTVTVRDMDTQARSLLSHLSELGGDANALAQILSHELGISDKQLRSIDEKYRID